MRSSLTAVISMLMAGLCLSQSALAQGADPAYPVKPIRILLSFPPGGSADQITRLVAPVMSERMGQPVIVENRPGAGGAIAIGAVAKAPPDGYTIGVGAAGGLGVNAVLNGQQPYNALKDLAPVGNMATASFILVAGPSFKPNTVSEVISEGRARPQSLSIAHGGPGTMMHLSTELFRHMSKVDAVVVPYKGTAPATLDAMAGQVSLAMSDVPSAISYLRSSRLKAIAVSSATRNPLLPEVPTLAESGLPGYESTGWIAMVAPAGTPPAIIKRLNAAMVAALKRPDVREKILASGYEPVAGTPEELGETMKSEIGKWGNLIRETKLKID